MIPELDVVFFRQKTARLGREMAMLNPAWSGGGVR